MIKTGRTASQTAAADTSSEAPETADENITEPQTTGKAKANEKQAELQKFSKYQLMTAPEFIGHRDILGALMGEDEKYTKAEAKEMIKSFQKTPLKKQYIKKTE